MNNFTTWAQRVESVQSLRFDPLNPRLPEAGKTDARAIIAELVEQEKVIELAEDIAEQGYFPTEVLVGIGGEDGETFIIEGNRRLAALKLILAPELAPASEQKRVQLLADRVDARHIREVPVVIAPSREAAAPLIARRHTQTGVRGWAPVQQARYIRSLAAEDMPIESLAKLVGLDKNIITSTLRQHAMYQLACGLDLPDDVKAVVHDPRKFAVSTFDRLTENRDVMDLLGVKFDERARPRVSIAPKEFEKTFKRMVTDVALGRQNSRTLNDGTAIRSYIVKLGADAPDTTPVEPYDPAPPAAAPAAPTSKPPRPRSAPTPRETASLVPRGVRSHLASPRIDAVLDELRRLKVATFPNASAVMLRILLEMLTSHYMDETGKIKPLLDKAKQEKKPKDWYPTCRQMLKALLADDDLELPPQARRRLKKMVEQDDHPMSLDEIDQWVHNRLAVPNEAHLRTFWGQLEALLNILLQPAPKPPTAPKPPKH